MILAVISHKNFTLNGGIFTANGGFVAQIESLAEYFNEIHVLVPVKRGLPKPSLFRHQKICLIPLTPIVGRGFFRRFFLLFWTLRNCRTISHHVRLCDAVHTPIPGDVGTIGILAALCLGKRLFVRYCGNWYHQNTIAEKFWRKLLLNLDPKRHLVLATGGGPEPPEPKTPHLGWIFSTTLRKDKILDLAEIARVRQYKANAPALAFVGRLEPEKGVRILLEAWPAIREHFPEATLHFAGSGSLEREINQTIIEVPGIVFHGDLTHDEVLDVLLNAHLFIFPTSGEGFPKVVHEAMACGLPVITNAVSVLSTLVDKNNGHLLEKNDAHHLLKAVKLCYEDRVNYKKKCEGALLSASSYSLEAWANLITSHLELLWGPLEK